MKRFCLLLCALCVTSISYGICAAGSYSKGEYPPGERPGTGPYEGKVHGSQHPDYKVRPLPPTQPRRETRKLKPLSMRDEIAQNEMETQLPPRPYRDLGGTRYAPQTPSDMQMPQRPYRDLSGRRYVPQTPSDMQMPTRPYRDVQGGYSFQGPSDTQMPQRPYRDLGPTRYAPQSSYPDMRYSIQGPTYGSDMQMPYQGRPRSFQGPSYGPDRGYRGEQYSIQGPQSRFDMQSPRFAPQGPRSDMQGPRFAPQRPQSRYDMQSPRFAPQGPRSDMQGPRFGQQGPQSRFDMQGPQSRYDMQGPRFAPQGPRSDMQGPRFGPQGPQSRFDMQRPQPRSEMQGPRFGPQRRVQSYSIQRPTYRPEMQMQEGPYLRDGPTSDADTPSSLQGGSTMGPTYMEDAKPYSRPGFARSYAPERRIPSRSYLQTYTQDDFHSQRPPHESRNGYIHRHVRPGIPRHGPGIRQYTQEDHYRGQPGSGYWHQPPINQGEQKPVDYYLPTPTQHQYHKRTIPPGSFQRRHPIRTHRFQTPTDEQQGLPSRRWGPPPYAQKPDSTGVYYPHNTRGRDIFYGQQDYVSDYGPAKLRNEAMRQNIANDLGHPGVRVSHHDGVVTLTGIVSSHEERKTVEAEVRGMAGVTTVINNLQVRP